MRNPGLPSPFFTCPSQTLPFSHLILATGSTGFFPGKLNQVFSQQEAIQAYENMVKQVSAPGPGRAVSADWVAPGEQNNWGDSRETLGDAQGCDSGCKDGELLERLLGGDLWICHQCLDMSIQTCSCSDWGSHLLSRGSWWHRALWLKEQAWSLPSVSSHSRPEVGGCSVPFEVMRSGDQGRISG